MSCNYILATLLEGATIPGTALGGMIADKWGKKLTICTSNFIAFGFWIIAAFPYNKYLLYLIYSFQGFFGYIGFSLVGKYKLMNREGTLFLQIIIVGIYIAETAESSLRRKLVPFHSIFQCIGFLVGYVTTAFLPWRVCYLILGSFVTLPAAFLPLLFHETPHWLIGKGRLDKARYFKEPSVFINLYYTIATLASCVKVRLNNLQH